MITKALFSSVLLFLYLTGSKSAGKPTNGVGPLLQKPNRDPFLNAMGFGSPTLKRRHASEDNAVRRHKIWELHPSVLCSVVGTCLSCFELRKLLGKALEVDPTRFTEHAAHREGVRFAT